jgi:hypothetical protein
MNEILHPSPRSASASARQRIRWPLPISRDESTRTLTLGDFIGP